MKERRESESAAAPQPSMILAIPFIKKLPTSAAWRVSVFAIRVDLLSTGLIEEVLSVAGTARE